jgi:hypothetical protein
MVSKAYISNCVWIPAALFTEEMRQELTLTVYELAAKPDDPPTIVESYIEDTHYIGVPRQYGLKLISKLRLTVQDDTCKGIDVTFPKKIKLYEEQKPVVEQMLALAEDEYDFTMKAATGKGKTVMALAFAQRRGKKTLVLVDQENLMNQWAEQIKSKLGVPKEQIGIIRSSTCTYEDCPIVIAMIQSLAARDYPEEVYFEQFGTVIVDEAHTAGAPTFSQALMMFSSRVRVGVSATIKRKDVLNKLIEWNIGTPRVILEAEHQPSNLYILNYDGVRSHNANASKLSGKYINELANDARRNLMCAIAIKWLYESGRKTLVIGDRIEQLRYMMDLVIALGVPKGAVGMYAKQTIELRYIKDPTPPRLPQYLEKGCQFTPVKLDFVQKTLPKIDKEKALAEAAIKFSTYGIMAKGVDVADLAGGMDITPRSEALQVHGRILRELDNKLVPIWVTIADTNSYRAMHQFASRLVDYETDNAEVYVWDFHKGRKPLRAGAVRAWARRRVKELRSLRIGTNLDGLSTIVTSSMETEYEALLGTPIEVRIPQQ